MSWIPCYETANNDNDYYVILTPGTMRISHVVVFGWGFDTSLSV